MITALVMMGLGMGLSMMPLNTHVLKAAPRKLVGRVTPLTADPSNDDGALKDC